ncbi:potassium channel family protein [Thiorhodococcus fuscus]|uniref:Potassium channel family protein n=1 Tax=Thiorhodococcus fuscus TaxID=527200 RepID=A0ABW4Y6F9_9GAMM
MSAAIDCNQRPPRRFAYLLGTLLLLILLHPLLVGLAGESVFFDVFLSMVVIASVYAVPSNSLTRMVFFVLTAPVLGARWLMYLVSNDAIILIGLAASAAFIALSAARILSYVMTQRTVTTEIILAALCVYLLFGVAWGLTYALIEQAMPGAFQIPGMAPDSAILQPLLYFSLVTLTTVGYGDISPQLPFAQAWANIEALLGQIYLAVLVARLVGIQVAQSMNTPQAERCERPERNG